MDIGHPLDTTVYGLGGRQMARKVRDKALDTQIYKGHTNPKVKTSR